jgi:hypothetical protein
MITVIKSNNRTVLSTNRTIFLAPLLHAVSNSVIPDISEEDRERRNYLFVAFNFQSKVA